MFEIRIDGPDYELIGSNFEYNAIVVSIPNGFQDKDYVVSYSWYKNDKEITLYRDKDTLKLYDAEGPASGSYRAQASISFDGQTEYASSNTIILEMGNSKRQITASIEDLENTVCRIGDRITFSPRVITNVKYPIISMDWKKDGKSYSSDSSITFENVNSEDAGIYTFEINVSAKGAYESTNSSKTIRLSIAIEVVCTPRYIHDLMPARNRGFVQMGWWVIDEIIKAKNEGFNWIENPRDLRFKYPCDIACLADGFSKWEDLCVQESRNGYIMEKADLVSEYSK